MILYLIVRSSQLRIHNSKSWEIQLFSLLILKVATNWSQVSRRYQCKLNEKQQLIQPAFIRARSKVVQRNSTWYQISRSIWEFTRMKSLSHAPLAVVRDSAPMATCKIMFVDTEMKGKYQFELLKNPFFLPSIFWLIIFNQTVQMRQLWWAILPKEYAEDAHRRRKLLYSYWIRPSCSRGWDKSRGPGKCNVSNVWWPGRTIHYPYESIDAIKANGECRQ